MRPPARFTHRHRGMENRDWEDEYYPKLLEDVRKIIREEINGCGKNKKQ